jgi:hypothetical protein
MAVFKAMLLILLVATLVFAGECQKACFYLDESKVKGELVPLTLNAPKKSDSILLDQSGLFEGKKRTCLWSLNGGSGTKEEFALDGDFAVPILDPACEGTFSHQETGVGFGDWYLTLCGSLSGSIFLVRYNQMELSVPLNALTQWTQYDPSKFPIEGDRE